MKLCQAFWNKTPTKGGGKTNKKIWSLSQKPKNRRWDTKGQRNKLCSRTFTSHKKHITKGKAKETWKSNKLKKIFTRDVATPLGSSVRMTLTLPKWGLWSPSGLSKIQNSIAGVKTLHLEVFFISLKRSWSVDIENGLAWAIQISAAQVMSKRRARSQIGSLTPDH
jgi:hypothetical protein